MKDHLLIDYDGTLTDHKEIRPRVIDKIVELNRSGRIKSVVVVSNVVGDCDLKHGQIIEDLGKSGFLKRYRGEFGVLPLQNEFLKPSTRIKPWLKVDLSRAFMVGDTKDDVLFARNLGIKFLSIYKFAKISQLCLLHGYDITQRRYCMQQFYSKELGFKVGMSGRGAICRAIFIDHGNIGKFAFSKVKQLTEKLKYNHCEKFALGTHSLDVTELKARIGEIQSVSDWKFVIEPSLDKPWGGTFRYG